MCLPAATDVQGVTDDSATIENESVIAFPPYCHTLAIMILPSARALWRSSLNKDRDKAPCQSMVLLQALAALRPLPPSSSDDEGFDGVLVARPSQEELRRIVGIPLFVMPRLI